MNKKNRQQFKDILKSKSDEPIITDPFGSYTGRALETHDLPIQDADDL